MEKQLADVLVVHGPDRVELEWRLSLSHAAGGGGGGGGGGTGAGGGVPRAAFQAVCKMLGGSKSWTQSSKVTEELFAGEGRYIHPDGTWLRKKSVHREDTSAKRKRVWVVRNSLALEECSAGAPPPSFYLKRVKQRTSYLHKFVRVDATLVRTAGGDIDSDETYEVEVEIDAPGKTFLSYPLPHILSTAQIVVEDLLAACDGA